MSAHPNNPLPPLDVPGAGPRRAPHLPVLVRDLMTPEVVSVEPTATVKDIAHALLKGDIRCVPVVEIGNLLVGMVSEADLVCREGYPTVRSHHLAGLIDGALADHFHHWAARAEGLTAEEIMTTDVVICAPDEPVAVVTRRMLHRGVRTLPVVDRGHLVGVLSRHDLLRLFDRPDSEIRSRVADLLADPLWAPEGHSVEASVIDGVVSLTGSVVFRSDVRIVGAIVRQIPGVVEVFNHVTGQRPDPKPYFARDTDIR